MSALPEPITQLVDALRKLPGIGPRSAERLALHLVQCNKDEVRRLTEALTTASARIQQCSVCGALTEAQPCGICADPRRDATLVCVVERAVDILSLEKAGTYRGKFHVLNGKISPLDGIGPEDLRIAELEQRLKTEPIREIILAMPTDVEGDATCFYLAKELGRPELQITRIAHGLPAGSGLEFADELTLSRALEGRRAVHP